MRPFVFFSSAIASGMLLFATAPAEAQTSRPLWIQNSCDHPVRVYGRWVDPVKGSLAVGPWNLAANAAPSRLVYGASDTPVIHTENQQVFIYGESTDSSGKYWQGSTNYTFSGATYPMMATALSVQDGHFLINLTCPSAAAPPPPPPAPAPADDSVRQAS